MNLGFGIIGCGAISGCHATALRKNPNARLVGVTDAREENGRAFAAQQTQLSGEEVTFFPTVEAMLESPDIQAVCICTPSGLHPAQAIQAAQAGRHVVVEKPMALTVEDADRVIEACERYGVKCSCISQFRFREEIVEAKRAVEGGYLGRMIAGDIFMKYHRPQSYYDSSDWRGTWKYDGGGALMNQGIHGVDMLVSIMGPVKTVFGYARTLSHRMETEDTASAVLEYASGALGMLQGTTSIYPGLPRRMEICGDRGMITMIEGAIDRWEVPGLELPAHLADKPHNNASFSTHKVEDTSGHERQIDDMVDAILTGRLPVINQYEARRPIELITAVYRSSQTGRPVELGR